MMDIHPWVTTANSIDGYKVMRGFGIVRGITCRSRSAFGQMGANIQQLFGGNITLYTQLAEQARMEAYELMIQHAIQVGANGVLAMRYDATELVPGVTEVIAYGTAVFLSPIEG